MTSGQEYPAMPPQPHSEEGEAVAESVAAEDERMRKRRAIGLSPQRTTARPAPQRPPQEPKRGRRKAWTLIGLVTALTLVTALLVLARMAGASTAWPQIVGSLAAMPGRIFSSPESGVQPAALFAADLRTDGMVGWRSLNSSGAMIVDFSEPGATLGQGAQLDAYVVGPDVDFGVYRMRLWPENVAWAIVGPSCAASYWIEAEALVDVGTPLGHAALVGRFQDGGNFYLFSVNGQQEYEVLLLEDGVWTSVQTAQYDAGIYSAGTANTLAFHDNGETMQFAVNGRPLYQARAPKLPAGQTGLAARAVQAPAQIDFERFRMASSPCLESQAFEQAE